MPKSLSSIIAKLEENPNIATIRVETWKSLQLAYVVYQTTSGAVLTALYHGIDLMQLSIFDPTTMTAKDRQALIGKLINDYDEKQMKVARMLNISQSSISLDLTMLAAGVHRQSTKPRLVRAA